MSNAAGMKPSAVETQCNYSIQVSYDANQNIEYFGKANIGTLTSDALWQIKKLSYDSNQNITTVEWADGDIAFNNVWDDRASLSYS